MKVVILLVMLAVPVVAEQVTGTTSTSPAPVHLESLQEVLDAPAVSPAQVTGAPSEFPTPWFPVQNHPGYGQVETVPPPGSE